MNWYNQWLQTPPDATEIINGAALIILAGLSVYYVWFRK